MFSIKSLCNPFVHSGFIEFIQKGIMTERLDEVSTLTLL